MTVLVVLVTTHRQSTIVVTVQTRVVSACIMNYRNLPIEKLPHSRSWP
jgi:hypothetical protein